MIHTLRPKRSATPSSVWGTTAACCYRPSTNTSQGSSNAWAKTAPIPAMTDYCKRRSRLASFLEYEYHVKDIAFKELKREFVEKFVVYLSSVQGSCVPGRSIRHIKKLKLMTYTAYKNGWIACRSFRRFLCQSGIRRTALPLGFGIAGRDGCQAPQLPNGHQPGCLRLLRLHGPEPCGRSETHPRGHPYGR